MVGSVIPTDTYWNACQSRTGDYCRQIELFSVLPSAFRRMREGYAFTGVCPSGGRGEVRYPLIFGPFQGGKGDTLSAQAPSLVSGPAPFQRYPPARIGVPPDQDRRNPLTGQDRTGYHAGGTHLAATQEDFLLVVID